jgi:predicted phospho-2-dehydro-3-deoxyheptonate aldolase
MDGRELRLGRILSSSGRALIVPIDQGLTSGPLPGLGHPRSAVETILEGRPDAMIMHRGPARALWPARTPSALIVHLSGGSELRGRPELKTGVCRVEDAIRLGADAVSVHISLGTTHDAEALRHLAETASSCSDWGMPLLAMMYVYGEKAKDVQATSHAARIAAELGADVVKLSYPGDPREFERLVDGCFVPVVVAGGPPGDNGWPLLQTIEEAIRLGAAGACVGRNVYQHRDPAAMVRALRAVVHSGRSARDAYDTYIAPGGGRLPESLISDELV